MDQIIGQIIGQTIGQTRDIFSAECPPGQVIGTQSTEGLTRQGADVEKVISIDNEALRIQPLVNPGWGRAGIVYGPYARVPGLALSVFMLNGHNTSEGNSIEETLKGRFFRWLRGSEANSISHRLWHWALSPLHRPSLKQFYRWIRNHKGRFKGGYIKENLAVGWFPDKVPVDPTAAGNSIVIRANGPENGELWTRQGKGLSPAFKGLQNLQTYYVVILRSQGAAYYAASVPKANGLSGFPYMRLVGIDAYSQDNSVYAGLYQSALGQVGFRVDTRVYGLHTEILPELATWYGTAQAADALTGEGGLEDTLAEVGERWRVLQGEFQRTAKGLIAIAQDSVTVLAMPEPAGAIHVLISAQQQPPTCALLWRNQGEDNTWGLFFENDQCQLKLKADGQWSQLAVDSRYGLRPECSNAVQVLDDGSTFSLYLEGALLFDQWFVDTRLQNAAQVGLAVFKAGEANAEAIAFQKLEAHSRHIPIPSALKLGVPWQREGSHLLMSDSFQGNLGDLEPRDLDRRKIELGDSDWRKEIGAGRMVVTGEGSVQVQASAQQPNPGRLAYTVAWPNPEFADLSVDIVPPGTDRQQGEKGRAGLIFWQDPDHYITISHWLDDTYGGASLSSFFHISGFEEIYDAVWTNVDKRILWGKQSRLRVTFDGMNFMAYIDGEPLLYRALSDVYPQVKQLSIQRVGLVANWEWGNDTGSLFSRFVAKA
ncbi:MAG: nucleotide-binding protein [Phormidesmis priestleyi]|uniref:Nucleotide-binding protein n=1 Tax=Phormidesmis priestleyi TaxID=268141 RepID=A0A2W4ZGI3_9CYAN|nr:MAG: nucleotide-binding protein [Phormidesmis priestleyi]